MRIFTSLDVDQSNSSKVTLYFNHRSMTLSKEEFKKLFKEFLWIDYQLRSEDETSASIGILGNSLGSTSKINLYA